MYPSNCVWCYFILAVMALPRDPRWTASNHIPESLHGTSQRASGLFAKRPSGSRCQSPEGNEHLLFFPLRWEEGIIPVTQIRKLSLIQGVRMKSVLFWKLLFLHYMCLSEKSENAGEHWRPPLLTSPPPPKQRPRNILTRTWTWATIPRQLILLWDSLCALMCMPMPLLGLYWEGVGGWGETKAWNKRVVKATGDARISELNSEREPYENLMGQAACPCLCVR